MNPFFNQLRNYTMFQIMKPYKLLPPPKCPVCKAPIQAIGLFCHKINNELKKDAAIAKAIKESIEFR